jgi:6-phosphogluconolactonase
MRLTYSSASSALGSRVMKFTKVAVAALVLLFGLTVLARGDVLYVAAGEGDLHAFRIDTTTGRLTLVPGTPLALGTFPRAMAIVPSGPFAYVIGAFPDVVVGFAIDPANGSPAPLAGSPFAVSGLGPIAVVTDGLGRFLYVGNNNSQDISAYAIASSGELTAVPGEPFPVVGVVGSGSIASDPLGRFLYLTSGAITAAFSVFRIDPATGALAHVPGSPFPIEPGPNVIAADPSGRFVYVINEQTELISAYAVGATSGVPSPIPGSPFSAGPRPLTVSTDPQGRFVFVGNFPGGVSVFSADATTGALTAVPGSPFSTGFQPNALQVTSTGRHLYVADPQGFLGPPGGVGGVWGHLIDPSTGSMSVVAGSPFTAGRSPWALATLKTPDVPASTCGEVKGKGSLSTQLHSRFSFTAEFRPGDAGPEGEVSYADAAAGVSFYSTRIDTLVIAGDLATIVGHGRANETSVRFQIDASEGRPGTFTIQLSNGYGATGAVARGHISVDQRCDHEQVREPNDERAP